MSEVSFKTARQVALEFEAPTLNLEAWSDVMREYTSQQTFHPGAAYLIACEIADEVKRLGQTYRSFVPTAAPAYDPYAWTPEQAAAEQERIRRRREEGLPT